MYELPPCGFSKVLPAMMKVARAWSPSSFDDTAMEPDAYGFLIDMMLYEPKLLKETNPIICEGTKVFSIVHKLFRRALANGQLIAFFCNDAADLKPIIVRHWATDAGNRELLDGYTFDRSMKRRALLVSDQVVEKLAGIAKREKTTSAQGREALKGRLTGLIEVAPEDPWPKSQVLDHLKPSFPGLSDRQMIDAWNEAVTGFPGWKRAGPRRRRSHTELDELIAALNRST